MKCPKCGKEIADDSKFCEFCGTKVESETTLHPDSILGKYICTTNCNEEDDFILYDMYAIPKNAAQESFSDIMSIAQSNIPDAICLLGFCFEHGIGAELNVDLANRYYYYAANMKSVPALRRLGDIFMMAEFGEVENWKRALDYFLQIEDVESSTSFRADVLKDIGMIYSMGDLDHGMQPDPYQSESYYLKSMSLGNYNAMNCLARLYLNSVNREKWPDGINKAEQILQKMDSFGVLKHDDALELANAYDELNSEANILSALKWYNKAFDLWFNEDAAPVGMILFDIEYIYQKGKMVNSDLPVQKDLKKAYELYKAIYHKLCQYKEEDYLKDDVIDAIMHVASVIDNLETNQYYTDSIYYSLKWLQLAANLGCVEAKNKIADDENYGQHYFDHYIPLIGEEKLFDLYATNQLE